MGLGQLLRVLLPVVDGEIEQGEEHQDQPLVTPPRRNNSCQVAMYTTSIARQPIQKRGGVAGQERPEHSPMKHIPAQRRSWDRQPGVGASARSQEEKSRHDESGRTLHRAPVQDVRISSCVLTAHEMALPTVQRSQPTARASDSTSVLLSRGNRAFPSRVQAYRQDRPRRLPESTSAHRLDERHRKPDGTASGGSRNKIRTSQPLLRVHSPSALPGR